MFQYFFITSYVIFCAYSFVFASSLPYSPQEILFGVSALGIVWLHLTKAYSLKRLYRRLRKGNAALLGMNIAGCGWLCALYGARYITPPVMLCINMGTVPIVHFVVTTPWRAYHQHKPVLLAMLCVVCSMGLIVWQTSGDMLFDKTYLWWGVILSILDGISGAYNGIFSMQLTKQRFNPSDILMLRFVLLCIVCGIWSSQTDIWFITLHKFQEFVLATFLMLIIPLWIYQKAIVAVGSDSVALFLPFIPICAYFIQLFMGDYLFNPWVFGMLLLCAATICIVHVVQQHRQVKS